ncbi:hypothetical protein ABH908_000065 [Pseudomonas frederiksbergensis]|uniref:hypothetical protein n=1 Tax=Pseudomonas TaxID=286 RepID=UPI003D1FFCC1
MSAAKQILKPASKLLITEFSKRGITLKPTLSYQLISAAFGFWSHESTVDYTVPFEVLNNRHYFGAKPQFHLSLLCERIERMLNLDHQRSEYLAQLIVDLLTHHYPIRVQTLKVLYESEYAATREMIFRILQSKNSEPWALASVGIALNRLPPLPANTIAGHLRLMCSAPMIVDKGPTMTVGEFIDQAPTRIWCYPSPFVKEAFPSLADAGFRKPRVEDQWIVTDIKPRTEIGVAFVLLQQSVGTYSEIAYTVVSGCYVLETIGKEPRWSDIEVLAKPREEETLHGQQELPEILGHPFDELPLLSHCTTCGDLKAAAGIDAPAINCSCHS